LHAAWAAQVLALPALGLLLPLEEIDDRLSLPEGLTMPGEEGGAGWKQVLACTTHHKRNGGFIKKPPFRLRLRWMKAIRLSTSWDCVERGALGSRSFASSG
jgi:hypothetical protein